MQGKIKKTLIISATIILLSFVIGFSYWLAYRHALQKTLPENLTTETPEATSAQNVTLSGEIKAISGYNLILVAEGDTFTIAVREDTRIVLIRATSESLEGTIQVRPEMVNAEFKDIKLGDKVNIIAELKDGTLEGKSVMITPQGK